MHSDEPQKVDGMAWLKLVVSLASPRLRTVPPCPHVGPRRVRRSGRKRVDRHQPVIERRDWTQQLNGCALPQARGGGEPDAGAGRVELPHTGGNAHPLCRLVRTDPRPPLCSFIVFHCGFCDRGLCAHAAPNMGSLVSAITDSAPMRRHVNMWGASSF